MLAIHLTIAEMLTPSVHYRIPVYQRRYEWGKEKHEVLWEDLKEARLRRTVEEGHRFRHFFGVLVRRDEGVQGSINVYDLIDGQQRLTAASILIKAVRDVYQEYIDHGGGVVDPCIQLVDGLLFNAHRPVPSADRCKLLPSHLDRHEYQTVLGLCAESEEVNSAIRHAYRHFRNAFRDEIEGVAEHKIGTLASEFITTITEGFALAVVTVGIADNDYQVFESLNGKGLPLSESDKVRNFCFMQLDVLDKKEIKHFYNDHWFPMQHALEKAAVRRGRPVRTFDKFMCHWTRMRTGDPFQDRKVYRVIRRVAEKHARVGTSGRDHESALKIRGFFLELSSYTNAYLVAEWPNEYASLVDNSVLVDRLNRFKQTLGVLQSAHPLLLCLLKTYLHGGSQNREAIIAVFDVLESYLVRRAICGIGTKSQQAIFQDLGADLHKESIGDLARIAPWIQTWLERQDKGRRWPDDIEFEQKFTELILELDQPGELLPYMFRRMEAEITGTPVDDLKDTRLDLASRCFHGADATMAGKLGNIVLIDVTDTTPAAAESRYVTTRECTEGTWDDHAVSRRAKRIIDLAIAIWPCPGSATRTLPQVRDEYRSAIAHPVVTPVAPAQEDVTAQSIERKIEDGQTGVTYEGLFGSYLKGAASVTLTDPFIRSSHQIKNLEDFAVLLHREDSRIAFHLIAKADDDEGEVLLSEKFDKLVCDFAKMGIDFTYEFNNTIHDRYIDIDDSWRIHMGRGLDIFYPPETSVACRHQSTRRCRAFSITVLNRSERPAP